VVRPFEPPVGPLVVAAAVPVLNASPHADLFVSLLAKEAAMASRKRNNTRWKKADSD